MTVTGDAFRVGLKQRITVPANQVLLDNNGMLRMAHAVMRDKLVPLMLSVNQNFFVIKDEVTTVEDQEAYPIPYRSIGRTLRDLKIKQSGTEGYGDRDMSLIALEDAHMFPQTGVPGGFYFMGDKYVVVPRPVSDDWVLVQYYDLQPSKIVQTTDAALVQSVSSNVVTCVNVPTTMTTGIYVDFVKGRQGCATVGMDAVITNVSGTQITFASADDVPDGIGIGDYIALAQESPVLQIPDEAAPLLETLTAERICYAIGDFDGATKLKADAAEESENLMKLIEPRVEGAQTKIVNRRGLLRGQGFQGNRFRGGWYSS
jgi:hypothetical protein